MNRFILLGPPGSGKGTQTSFLQTVLKIPQISTGDMLRAAAHVGDELGEQIHATMQEGKLVSDELILQLIVQRVTKEDCRDGYILDGFPRTIVQAEGMQAHHIKIDYIIELGLDDSDIIKRISGRRVHLPSGRTYHVQFNPPKHEGYDDITGEPLTHRADDKKQTVQKRLEVYHQQTRPLIDYYKNLCAKSTLKYIQITGAGSVSKVRDDICSALAVYLPGLA